MSTAKEYLSRAKLLDQRIERKLEQIESLKSLVTKVTSAISGMPGNPSRSSSRLEEMVAKIMDLEEEIDHDIDELVDIKQTIGRVITHIDKIELQTILESRYLLYKSWEQIADGMKYTTHHVYKMHNKALAAFEKAMQELNAS